MQCRKCKIFDDETVEEGKELRVEDFFRKLFVTQSFLSLVLDTKLFKSRRGRGQIQMIFRTVLQFSHILSPCTGHETFQVEGKDRNGGFSKYFQQLSHFYPLVLATKLSMSREVGMEDFQDFFGSSLLFLYTCQNRVECTNLPCHLDIFQYKRNAVPPSLEVAVQRSG